MSTIENLIYGIKKEVYFENEDASDIMASRLEKLIKGSRKKYEDVIVFCIGTDKIIFDSIGPLVGTFLSENKSVTGKCRVVGTLDNPAHALNIKSILDTIDTKKSLIIAVDASFGERNHIGNICLSNGSISPGAGFGKKLPPVGDISVTVIVSDKTSTNLTTGPRLSQIYNMSKVVATGITSAINNLDLNLSSTIKNNII